MAAKLARLSPALLQIFFYVDPAFLDDPQMENVKSLTLSYTFFRTGEPEVLDIANEYQKREAASALARSQLARIQAPEQAAVGSADVASSGVDTAAAAQPHRASSDANEAIRRWTAEVAAKTGTKLPQQTSVAAASPPRDALAEAAPANPQPITQ
jgi:hypothetical protein